MRGLLRRTRPDRGLGEETTAPAADEPTPDAVHPSSDTVDGAPADGDPQAPLPAGVAPEELVGGTLDTRRRGRLRRRLRHLRQVRELMLRDVGGLVYEFHRAGAGSGPGEPGAVLVGRKLEKLTALDAERRALEERLDDRRSATVLREPGIGGACSQCGDYFASDARFCAHCGLAVNDSGAGAASGPDPVATGAEHDEKATAPAGSESVDDRATSTAGAGPEPDGTRVTPAAGAVPQPADARVTPAAGARP